ncbi:MAG: glutamate mutase L, partial [Actinobacteria bacterium]|nr:glutamate mutase L [Actinomycetota bacterium]
MTHLLCVDIGSTFTKAALVEETGGVLVARASVATTAGADVLDGVRAARADLAVQAGAGVPEIEDRDRVLICSSAGGGLRLAVVGYEREITAEAGGRVGLSAGAKVVHVVGGALDGAAVAALRAVRPDVVLLVGGTDGGNAECIRHNAERLGRARLRAPVVVAGNRAVQDEVAGILTGAGRRHVLTDNVLPRIGEIAPVAARRAIREVFLRHVIGGKGLSRGPLFAALVRAATPDAVLDGVQVVAGVAGADVMVLDVGGATTDAYS